MKKFIVIFIVISIVLSGVAVFLQFSRVPYKFQEVEGGVELKKYTGISTEQILYIDSQRDEKSKLIEGGLPIVSLADFAVANNEFLSEIHIGASLKTITDWSFVNNRNLKKFVVDEANANFSAIDGVLYNKDGSELIAYPNFKDAVEVAYKDGVQNPEGKDIYYESSFTVPSSVKIISNNAFYKCRYVAYLTLPQGLETIGDRAFHEIDRLRTPIIPEGVKTIGIDAFSYNTMMRTELVLPSTLTKIGQYAFFGCRFIPQIVFDGAQDDYNKIELGKKCIPVKDGELIKLVPVLFK